MKIENYSIELQSSSIFKATQTEYSSLKTWVDSPSKDTSKENTSNNVLLNISNYGKQLAQSLENTELGIDKLAAESAEDIPDEADRKQKLIIDFIYILTGKKLKFVDYKDLKDRLKSVDNPSANNVSVNNASVQNIGQGIQRVGWGINFQYSNTYFEQSQVSFSATGKIKTADGREIDMTLNLNMSRSFYSSTNLSFKAGDALIDPLVLNLENTPASLSGNKIFFDINLDGSKEEIALPNSTSGFLALDKNNNGSIDDGSELFGPQSGDGFGELTEYDTDKNGWIDENDPIYSKLQIWQHDENGNAKLLALGKAGVGAIYLEGAKTEFKYADNQNNTQGMLRETGLFLREDGTAGTIQHIDLTI